MKKILVIGGGPVGLSIAYRLLKNEADVIVLDNSSEASGYPAAAGILYPTSATGGDEPSIDLLLQSLSLWPLWESEIGGGLSQKTGLFVSAEKNHLKEIKNLAENVGADIQEGIDFKEARFFSEKTTKKIEAFFKVPEARVVDPISLTKRLRAIISPQITKAKVSNLLYEKERVAGVVADNEKIKADTVIVSPGALGFDFIAKEVRPRINPMAGEALLLCAPGFAKSPILESIGGWGPLVPRGDDTIWLGNSYREYDGDGAKLDEIERIIKTAKEAFPPLSGARVLKVLFGVRPLSSDGLPYIGPTSIDGLFIAAGHGRNGILMSPLAADQISDWVLKGEGDARLLPGR